MTTSADYPQSGSGGALLAVTAADPWAAGGTLFQQVDAKPFHGGGVRFRAALRATPGDTGAAVLWLKVKGRRSEPLSYVASARPDPGGWTFYDLTLAVPRTAQSIAFGVRLTGPGRIAIDSASLAPLSAAQLGYEPPRALTARGLANLEAFTRLYGYVRFFHPSDQSAAADWDAVAIAGVQRVERASTPQALAVALQAVFAPLAPTLRVFPTAGQPRADPAPPMQPPVGATAIHWVHHGVLLGGGDPAYHEAREPLGADRPERVSVALSGGVSASMPTSVYRIDGVTWPAPAATPIMSDKPADFAPSGDDRATRLAGIVETWTVLQHFNPYFGVEKPDWPAELRKALRSAATDTDNLRFEATFQRLNAALKDNHGIPRGRHDTRSLPLAWEWIEGQLIVTGVRPGWSGGLQVGDVVVAMDGVPIKNVLARRAPLTPAATPQFRTYARVSRLLSVTHDGPVRLDVIRAAGGRRTFEVTPVRLAATDKKVDEVLPAAVSELRPGVFYVDLSRISKDDLAAWIDRLAGARALVLDARRYPTVAAQGLFRHVSDRVLHSDAFKVPIFVHPDHRSAAYDMIRPVWNLAPVAPRVTGKLVMLVGAGTGSYGESLTGVFVGEHLGTLVGETTAGTNGDVIYIDVPGGYVTRFSGLLTVKHDGSLLHGVGYRPDVLARRTLAGVRAGRDDALEAALAVAGG